MNKPTPAAIAALATLFLAAPAAADEGAAPPPVAELLKSQVGQWTGTLEYRDYQADRWFGLPVQVTIAEGGDGVTQIRTADFDDGPRVGNVRIITLSMLGADGTTEYSTGFRKGRVPALSTARLTVNAWRDAAHWTLVAEEQSTDDNRPAMLRYTTVRDGSRMTTLKEVDFTDDQTEEWLTRNRTTLERVGE